MSAAPSLREATRTWAYVGINSFGGPAGQIAVMHRVVVDERKWVDEKRYLHALNFCMVLPGPEALQLAVYLGLAAQRCAGRPRRRRPVRAAGPGRHGGAVGGLRDRSETSRGSPALLFGIQAAVVAIVVQAVVRVGRRALRTPLLVGLARGRLSRAGPVRRPLPARRRRGAG